MAYGGLKDDTDCLGRLTKLLNETYRSIFQIHSAAQQECNDCTIAKNKRG